MILGMATRYDIRYGFQRQYQMWLQDMRSDISSMHGYQTLNQIYHVWCKIRWQIYKIWLSNMMSDISYMVIRCESRYTYITYENQK